MSRFLDKMDILFSPDLYIIGGGVSKKHEKFFPALKTSTPVIPAALRNHAGIIGAALAASVLLEDADSAPAIAENLVDVLTDND